MSIEIIHSTNLEAMRDLSRSGRRFALAYLDPPFFTQATWKTADGEVAFEDRWASLDEYVRVIMQATVCAWELLIPEGSVVLHVDPETSHYLKVALDGEIGRERFASEIVWRYRRWPTPTKNFQKMHDVLLRYIRNTDATRWNQLYEPLSPKTIAQWGNERRQEARADASGRRAKSVLSAEPSPGAAISDVWDDVGIIGPSSGERTGYPTQKPEKLLERLILSCTNEGDSVLDPFCGSGTTLAVAHRLGRHAVGIDASPVAVRYARERVAPLLAQPSLFAAAEVTP